MSTFFVDVDVDTKSWSRHTSQSQSSEGETNYSFQSSDKFESISVISPIEKASLGIENTISTIHESPTFSDDNSDKSVQNDQPETNETQQNVSKNLEEASLTSL